jgi:hypothetical protein
MPRSRIEIYWRTPETAPEGVIAQVLVSDDSGSDYLLPYPCELTKDGWVNAASGKPLAVRVTYWKPYVETTLRSKRTRSGQGRQNDDYQSVSVTLSPPSSADEDGAILRKGEIAV